MFIFKCCSWLMIKPPYDSQDPPGSINDNRIKVEMDGVVMHKGIHMLEQILCDGDGTCMYMNVCKKEKNMQKLNAKTSINHR